MGSLNFFDIFVMIIFTIISFSLYKALRGNDSDDILVSVKDNVKNNKKGGLLSIAHLKDKKQIEQIFINTLKNESLDVKVESLMKMDKTFEPQTFMTNAKNIFESVFRAFYAKDIKPIKQNVSDTVYHEFENSISELDKSKESITAEIVRFKTITIKDISLLKKKASVFVEFVSEQTASLKNSEGKVLKGDDNQIETMTDIWCFSKDLTKKNPDWILEKTIEC